MDRRYDARLKRGLARAEAPTDSVAGLLWRPEAYVVPCAASPVDDARRRQARAYLTGLPP